MNIILLKKEELKCVWASDNLNDCIYKLEELAQEMLKERVGNKDLNIIKRKDLIKKPRGIYLVSDYNKITMYERNKNGWFYTGDTKEILSLELIITRKQKVITGDKVCILKIFNNRNVELLDEIKK